MTDRPRVLVIAEMCNPEWVSVPLVGWSHFKALRETGVADVHLVTHERNREAIERAGLVHGVGGDFTALDSDKVAAPLWKLGEALGGRGGKGYTIQTAAITLSIPYFERLLWRKFGPDLKAGKFDLVHQLTPLSPTNAPRTAKRCAKIGVPFLWGPINGGVPWPRAFDSARRKEREWLSYVRGLHRLLPGHRASRRHTSGFLVASGHTWRELPEAARERATYVPENAIDPAKFTAERTRTAGDGPIRLAWLGRLVPYKGGDMALEAARPLIEAGRMTLTFYGTGPEEARLREMAQGLDGVRFAGWVDHAEVPARLAEHDLFLFPSIREFGGGVILEAWAVGLPTMIVDYAGPAELVHDGVGWKVPLGTRGEIVAALRRELEAVAADPARIDAKGRAAYEEAHERHTWANRARSSRRAYDWLLGRAPKPDAVPPGLT